MILFFFDDCVLGDAQRATLALMGALDRSKHPFRALVPSREGELPLVLARMGVETDVLAPPRAFWRKGLTFFERWSRLAGAVAYQRKLFRYFKMYGFDIVHADGLGAHALSVALKIRFDVSLVWSFWAILPSGFRLSLFTWAAAVFCDHVLASSMYVAHQLGRSLRWRGKLHVSYRGYDAGRVPVATEQSLDPLMIIAGELLAPSGYKAFLRALELVRIDLPECRGLIFLVGNERRHIAHREELEGIIAQMRLAEAVRIEVLSASDQAIGLAHALASHSGAVYVNTCVDLLPFTSDIAEAMGAGLPIVASRTGVFSELIVHDGNGLLATAGDANAIAQAVLRLFNEPETRSRIRANARREFESRFGLARYVATVEAIYESIFKNTH